MKLVPVTIVLLVLMLRCSFFPGPKNVDWREAWAENEVRLKKLKNSILKGGRSKYQPGINNFPEGFEYPFDDGFSIARNVNDTIGFRNITITFYTDRGLLDHYSAIVFTIDSLVLKEMEDNVKNGGNDFKIEENWYAISD